MHYINGEWVEGNGARFRSENPATGMVIREYKSADSVQVEAAVNAAGAAFARWAATPYDERAAVLTRFRDLLEARRDELAACISEETGKIGWDAQSEAAAAIGKLAFSLKAYAERTPTRTQALETATAALTHRPHGVMAVFGPYNFPAHLPGGHIIPALLAGNTVVFKPSELTPATGEWLTRRWEEAGLPPGVLNLVQGKTETGIALAEGNIDGLLFTGSVETGLKIHQSFAGRPDILLALELGGNNPLIIDQIDDIKSAVLETILSAYLSTGQRCTCARRLIVIDSPQADAYLDALKAAIASLRIGAPGDTPSPFMGPLISNREADKLLAAQDDLRARGADTLNEMRRLHDTLPFISPALLDVTSVADLPDHEHFGPFLQLIRVRDLDTAIRTANATRFGLSAGMLTNERARFETCLHRLKAGIVNWNQQTTGASGMAPFGGIGCSGNHRPAGYYAADYCAFPVASMQRETLALPDSLPPGLTL